jgi:hypothetical protein
MTNEQIPVTPPAATTNTTIEVSNNEQSSTRLSDAVMDILDSRVSGGTKKGYCNSNAQFAVWIYTNLDENVRERLLAPWLIRWMIDAKHEATVGINFRSAASKEKKELAAITKVAKKAMMSVNSQDNNCPILLQNLTFRICTEFLVSKHHSTAAAAANGDGSAAASTKKFKSTSTYEKARSAIVFLHKEANIEMDPEIRQRLCNFMSGLKRKVQDEKKRTGVSLMEGKRKMSFQVYEKICELMVSSPDANEFAHCFLVLEWNLMARSENVVDSHVENIYFDNDCLVFQFAKTKCDQTGKNADQLWHVYATPNNPVTCPVLALARYLFANPGVMIDGVLNRDEENGEGGGMDQVVAGGNTGREREGTTTSPQPQAESRRKKRGLLFPGGNQYQRFMGVFHKIILSNREEFSRLGIQPGDLGSHSARKGACSFASAGCTVSPPIASICLRACWSMGPVKERYLFYEKAGDQFLGRAVSGMNMMSMEFAVSPPYFDASTVTDDQVEQTELDERIDKFVLDSMVGGATIPSKTFIILRNCFASICYHFDFLQNKLHLTNKLRASSLFTSIPNEIKEAAVVRYPWNKTKKTPTFSGLPPHVVLMAQMKDLKQSFKEEMRNMQNSVLKEMKDEFDTRRLGTDGFFETQTVLNKMQDLHEQVLQQLGNQISSGIRGGTVGGGGGATTTYNEEAFSMAWREDEDEDMSPEQTQVTRNKYNVHWNSNAISRIPKGFILPDMTLCTLITCWYTGNEYKKIAPYRFLKMNDFEGDKIQKKKIARKLSNMKRLMRLVELCAQREQIIIHRRTAEWNTRMTVDLYNGIKHYFEYGGLIRMDKRHKQLSWKTVLNHYIKKKGFANEIVTN